jgi:hypothetical protein
MFTAYTGMLEGALPWGKLSSTRVLEPGFKGTLPGEELT